MSVRIYQLSKELDITNKELIEILNSRGLAVTSASSSIPNIYADSLIQDFKKQVPAKEKVSTTKAKDESLQESFPVTKIEKKEIVIQPGQPLELKTGSPKFPTTPKTHVQEKLSLPEGRFVRTATEIALEKEKQKPANNASAVPQAPFVPAAIKPAPTAKSDIVVATMDSTPAAVASNSTPILSSAPQVNKLAGSAPQIPPKLPPKSFVVQQQSDKTAPDSKLSTATGEQPAVSQDSESTVVPKIDPNEVKLLSIKPPIVVREFAALMDIKPFRLISELMEMGIFASMSQVIEEEIAAKIAQKHGYLIEVQHRKEVVAIVAPVKKKEVEKPVVVLPLEPRPPIVCVLGHVDHGKTTLLDVIRKASVAAGEAGGITQHIGAYQVEQKGHKITFLDTPGHAAFSKMRERGANATDIAILVVAADDGFMPQTDEALKFAQKAHLPIVVAINKMDAKGANIDRVKQQMQQRNIASEDWGGETLCTPVSAIKGQNIEELLELVLLQAEVLELKAPVQGPAEGLIIESQIEIGRGCTATVLVQKGTLKPGDALVCGQHSCKVRALLDENGKNLKQALPGTPARVIGWSNPPETGNSFEVCKNEKEAKQKAEEYALKSKQQVNKQLQSENQKPITVDDLFAAISTIKDKTFKVIVKADVHGSLEALVGCLEAIPSNKVKLEVIDAQVGPIGKNDILMANTTKAAIVGFNVKIEAGSQPLAKHHNISVIQHTIIYELIDQVKAAMAELLEPEIRENKLGSAQVRQIFPLAKSFVAGCMVTDGRITRDGTARLIRAKKIIHESTIDTLKRFKEDANEVKAGYECGISLKGFSNYQSGDIIECFELIKVPSSL
jgi:translation initiation factor IF-2